MSRVKDKPVRPEVRISNKAMPPEAKATRIGYMPKAPDGKLQGASVYPTEHMAQQQFFFQEGWPKAKAAGHRVVKVRIEEA